jgi:hypothetical protein
MSMGSVDMVEEIVPYLGMDQMTWIHFHVAAPCMPRSLLRGCAATV